MDPPRQHGTGTSGDPILRPMDTFECKDAVLDLSDPDNPKEPDWPRMDFIVGNPPFLGGKKIGRKLEDEYFEALGRVYGGRLPHLTRLKRGVRTVYPKQDSNKPPVPRQNEAASETTFTWLHLTDLHQGVDRRGVWTNVEHELHNDLSRVYQQTGPWDAVVFTGDLTQSGQEEEFKEADGTLARLWECFDKLGFNPYLLAVPGNHDLIWRDSDELAVALLLEYTSKPEIQEKFWKGDLRYRKVVKDAFANYEDWWDNTPVRHPQRHMKGILPGDFSAEIEKDGHRLRFVGLNSAFLQLVSAREVPNPQDKDEPYHGRLALDRNQFNAVCEGHGRQWISDCSAALLLTHHPPDWLSRAAQDQLVGEINPPGSFVAHLYGHMHRGLTNSISKGGAPTQHFWQGSALLSLESNGNLRDRLHGYTVGSLALTSDGSQLRFWPRKMVQKHSGELKFDRDTAYYLQEDGGAEPVDIWRKPGFRRTTQFVPGRALERTPAALIRHPANICDVKAERPSIYSRFLEFARERDIVFALGGAGSGMDTFRRQFFQHLSRRHVPVVDVADFNPDAFRLIRKARRAAEEARIEDISRRQQSNRANESTEEREGLNANVHLELKCLLTSLAYATYSSLRTQFQGELDRGTGRFFQDSIAFADYYFASCMSGAMDKADSGPILEHFFVTIQAFAEMTEVEEVLVFMPWPALAGCFREKAQPDARRLGTVLWRALGNMVSRSTPQRSRIPYAQPLAELPPFDLYDKVCLVVCCSEVPYAHNECQQKDLVARCIWPLPPLSETEVGTLFKKVAPELATSETLAELMHQTGGSPWFVRLLLSYLIENQDLLPDYQGDSSLLMSACVDAARDAIEADDQGLPNPVRGFIKRQREKVREALGDGHATDAIIEEKWAGPDDEVSDGYRIEAYRLEAFVASGLIWLKGDPWDRHREDYVFATYPRVLLRRARELPLAMYRSVTGKDVRLTVY